MKVIKNKLNTKGKKVFVIAAVLFVLITIGIAVGSDNKDANTYETVVQSMCDENYDAAREYIELLPDNYRDTASIISLLDLIENFDESDKAEYSNILEKLEKIKLTENKDIIEIYNSFKARVTELENQYQSDKAAAEMITAQITSAADGNVNNITLADEEKLVKARSMYDEASEDVKELVENYAFLHDAEQRIKILKEYKASADAVSEKIKDIGTVTLNSENTVNSAYEAYENLSDEAKAYVSNSDELISAKKQIENLKEQKAQQEREKQNKSSNGSNQSNNSNANYGTVYWVSSGEVYHISRSCPTLSRSKNVFSGSAPSGRRPCKVCS